MEKGLNVKRDLETVSFYESKVSNNDMGCPKILEYKLEGHLKKTKGQLPSAILSSI